MRCILQVDVYQEEARKHDTDTDTDIDSVGHKPGFSGAFALA